MGVYIADGVRTPIGRFGGSLASLRATELASIAAESLLERNGVPPSAVQRVIAGMVLQDMTESNPARIVAKRIGVPDSAPAFTVNQQCASGMLTLILAAQQIVLGEADCILVLGLESMSNAPHMVAGARWGLRLSHATFIDTLKECALAGSKMWGDPCDMVGVAERHAAVDGIRREEMDEYAVVSHHRAAGAIDAGRFDAEIVPIRISADGSAPVDLGVDEHPRRDASVERLATLKPVRSGGTITAGNASGINDGAAAAVVCSDEAVARLGLDPIARVPTGGWAMLGCDPNLMGYSAVEALDGALANLHLEVDDLDLIECNEGFAVQLLACERIGGWPRARLNVDGGSVGLGHPVGMSGLRIAIHLAHALRYRDLQRGAATVPAGSGLGAAVVLERASAAADRRGA